MTLIKISDKHANELRLRFDQQINLNPEKKYKLGVIKMLFSGTKISIENFSFKVVIPGKDGSYEYLKSINGAFTLDELRNAIQNKLTETYHEVMRKYEREKREDLINYLKSNIKHLPVKLEISPIFDSVYDFHIVNFKTPLELKIINGGNFCGVLGFENCSNSFKSNNKYASSINPKFLKPISVLEVHSNITTISYANHESHPHSHNEKELLYVSFVDKLLFPGVNYLDSPKKIFYVPLKEGLREIREIQLTLLDQNHNEIKDISNVIVYLQLLEQ